MNSQRPNALLYARLVFAISIALLINGAANPALAHRAGTAVQDEEKMLDIIRYPNEPVELVDLKIREKSVTNKINSRVKGNSNQVRQDSVSFREGNDWFKNVKLRLRNISGRPIYGLAASLIFVDNNLQTGFKISLKESEAKELTRHPLQQGEEIDLAVDDARAAQVFAYMIQNGVDINRSSVQLSVESASFGEDFGWQKGMLMRRNSLDPRNWEKIDRPETPENISSGRALPQKVGEADE